MTNLPTPIQTPFDLLMMSAVSFGLFAPGALMAARRTTPSPSLQPK